MQPDDQVAKRVEVALEIQESLGQLIRLASPTKEKVYRIYRQFREWGYHYCLEDVQFKCEEYYKKMNRFNQSRLIKELFRIAPSSEVSSLLALNFRSSKLEFSELNEISNHLLSLLKRCTQLDHFGVDCFLVQAAIKRLTSPNWNHGDIFFSFEEFFDVLSRESFRRFGDRYEEKLSLLFYSMDPISNAEQIRPKQNVSAQSKNDETQPGLFVDEGGIYSDKIQSGEIERDNDQKAFNDDFSVNTQVLLQAEFLWLKEIETELIIVSKKSLPSYPLKKESSSKSLRELEDQVKLFNQISQFESKNLRGLQKYSEIKVILKNTISINVQNILAVYNTPVLEPIKINGPGAGNVVKIKQYILPGDLMPFDIDFLVEQLSQVANLGGHAEIEYRKFSALYIIKTKDLLAYCEKSSMVA